MTFPASPTNGQQATEGGRLFQWNGSNAWELVANVAGHAAQHATGGSDAITPASIGAVATSDARLTDTRTPTDGSVTTAKIADSAVTDAKIASVAATKLTGTLDDARLSGSITRNDNLRWAMQANASSIDWFPRGHGSIGNASLTSGSLALAFFTAPYSMAATTLTFGSGGTATASLTLCRFALFTVSETITDSVTATLPVITLVARTASDTTIGSATNTMYSRSFSTAGGWPASYELVAGTRYAAGILVVGTTAGLWQAATTGSAALMRLPPMAAGVITGLSDMPSAATVANGNFMLYGRIS